MHIIFQMYHSRKTEGILLRDILESGISWIDKSYALTTRCQGAIPSDTLKRHRHTMVAESMELQELSDDYFKGGFNEGSQPNLIGKIVCDNTSDNNGQPAQGTRIYSPNGKSICLDADSRKYIIAPANPNIDGKTNALTTVQKDNAIAEPVCLRYERTEEAKRLRKQYENHEIHHGFNEFRTLQPRTDGKSNTISTVQKDNMIAEPVRVGEWGKGAQGNRLYSVDGKSPVIRTCGGEHIIEPIEYPIRNNSSVVIGDNCIRCKQNKNGATVAESCCYFEDGKCGTLTTARAPMVIERSDGKTLIQFTKSETALITIKDKQYPIPYKTAFT